MQNVPTQWANIPEWMRKAANAINDLISVSRPGAQSTGQVVISSNTTLGDAHKGANLLLATPGITITFPATGFESGEGCELSNVSGGNVTFSFAFASDMGATFPNNGTVIVRCDGAGFWRQYCYSTSRL